MTPENYIIAAAAISTAGIALVIEPTSKLLTAVFYRFTNKTTKGKKL